MTMYLTLAVLLLPAVPMFRMEISPKYEPAFNVASTVLPSVSTT